MTREFVRTALKAFIYIFGLAMLLSACEQGGDEISWNPTKKGFGSNSSSSNNSSNGSFGSGQVTGADMTSETTGFDYPVTEYFANGNLQSISDRNAIQVESKQEFSAENVIAYTLRFTSSDREINKRVVNLTGQTVYKRVPKKELANREHDQGFKNEAFLMFMNSNAVSNGNGSSTLNYNQPVPFIVVPAELKRYESLDKGIMSYDFIASGSGSFAGTVSYQKGSVSGNIIQIIQSVSIPADTNGQLYDLFPLPRSATYHIDYLQKKVVRIDVSTIYYNSRLKKARDMTLTMELCRYTLNGQSQNSPCSRN